jgi:hypothetical protein
MEEKDRADTRSGLPFCPGGWNVVQHFGGYDPQESEAKLIRKCKFSCLIWPIETTTQLVQN